MSKPQLSLAEPLAMPERKIPFSMETEQHFLGAVLMHNELLYQTRNLLKPEHFYAPAHQRIFAEILALFDKGHTASPVILRRKFDEDDGLREVGGGQYLARLIAAAGGVVNPVDYANYIHDLFQRRRLFEICEDFAESVSAEDKPVIQKITELRSCLDEIERSENFDFLRDNHLVTDSLIKSLQRGDIYFSTGLPSLDKAMDGGLYPGKSYGFAARKKTGKTALAATISTNLNAFGVKHAFIAGEMNAEEIQQRILNRLTDTYPSSFRSNYGKSQDFTNRLTNALSDLPKNTWFIDAPGLSFEQLRRMVPVAIEQKKMKGFILDYWQLVGGKQKGQSMAEHLDEVAQWIANYCKRTGCFSITMAQLNQDDNTRGSEGIRLAFDQVYALIRKNLGEPNASLEMLETRYTAWVNIDGLYLNAKGPYFEER